MRWLRTRDYIFGLLSDVLPFLVVGSKLLVKLLHCFLSCTSLAVEVSFRVKGGAMDALLDGSA